MNGSVIHFSPGECKPQDLYKVLSGSIIPRPIAFVSTIDAKGIPNLAPFSFFTGVGSNPPVVCFSPVLRSGEEPSKDTLRNVRETHEFVVNIVSEEFVEKMNMTAAEVGPEIDEFDLSGLTPVASELVKPPRVAESKVQMECRVLQIVPTGNQPGSGVLVLGEVVRFHVQEAVFDNFRIDPTKLHAVGRLAGTTYVRTTDTFDLERPK